MLALICLSAIVVAASAVVNESAQDLHCPLWTALVNGSCKCGNNLRGTVGCDDSEGATKVKKCFCMTTRTGENSPLVGTCLYRCNLLYPQANVIGVNTTTEVTNETCGVFKRTGVMCGECLQGYGLPVYSYSLSCVECVGYKFNWLKYIAVAYIPLTAFFIMVIVLRISATSGYLLGYVAICQMLTIKSLATLLFNMSFFQVHKLATILITMASFWNLDFFRSMYPPFCLSPHITVLQVQLLDYLVGVYPLVLVLLTYGLVKLHDRFGIVIYVCKPFYKCLHVFIKEWDIKTSLIGSFATFYLLSYVKILNVTADILTPTHFYAMDGTYSGNFYYFNGSLPYLGSEHLPYAVFAIVVSFLFNVLPLLLLVLYPCLCFQRCLNKTKCRCHVLHVFMDAILGAYTCKPRERRYFGVFYLVLRIVHMFGLAVMNVLLYIGITSYIMAVVVVSVVAFAPYRNKWHTVIDFCLFSAVLHVTFMLVIYREGMLVAPVEASKFRKVIYNPTAFAAACVVPHCC